MSELLSIGTRIRFTKRLTEDACGDHPAFLYCEPGQLGTITHEGGKFHRYYATADHWPSAAFGLNDGEFEVIEPKPEGEVGG